MRTHKRNFLTLLAVAVVSSSVTLLLVLGVAKVGAHPQQYTGNENHVITLDQAVKYVQNFKNFPAAPTIKSLYFGKNIFDKILSQPGCVGIRCYYGKADDGTSNLVLVGVDGGGNDITSGILGDIGWPCPPFCGAPSQLNR